MIIQHNLPAMNAFRQLGINVGSLNKSVEKLSSGYKINRAADNAAGLAISEKMRRQVRGLTQASANCQDGISLVQIADGALNEIHDMLHRGTELSIQAANDTLTAKDRDYIQTEISQIISEIGQIRDKATFNERPVLRGGESDSANYRMNSEDGVFLMGKELPDFVGSPALKAGYMNETYTSGSDRFPAGSIDFRGVTEDNVKDLIGTSFNIDCSTCEHKYTFKFSDGSGTSTETSGQNFIYTIGVEGVTNGDELVSRLIGESGATPSGHYTTLENQSGKLVMHDNRPWTGETDSKLEQYQRQSKVMSGEAYSLDDLDDMGAYDVIIQAGSEAGESQTVKIRLPIIDLELLNLDRVDVRKAGEAGQALYGNFNEGTGEWTDVHSGDVISGGPGEAIGIFKRATEYVSRERSRMGAYQNRLEHTVNNLDNVVENTTAAESRIRDADMAREMVRYSMTSILVQAGQSMLAQANQSRQGVLSLLG